MKTLKELEETQANYQQAITETQQRLETLIKESIFLSGRIAQLKECDQQHEQTKEED